MIFRNISQKFKKKSIIFITFILMFPVLTNDVILKDKR